MEDLVLEYSNLLKTIKNPINEDGNYKDYKLIVLCWYSYEESSDELEPNSRIIGYFDSIDEVKEFLNKYKDNIDLEYSDVEEYEYCLCRCNKPFPKNINKKAYNEKKNYEDGMKYCPYCGKWRYFFEGEFSGSSECTACGVSDDNYDVVMWNTYGGII